MLRVLDREVSMGRNVLVASLRIDAHLFATFAGPGIVYSYAEDEAGHPPIDEYDGGPHSSQECADLKCDWAHPGNGRHPQCGGSEEDLENLPVLIEAFRMMDSAAGTADIPTMSRLIAVAPLKLSGE